MKPEERILESSDGKNKLHVVLWKPEGDPRGLLQICHGMSEYIMRYEEFADFMVSRGYVVAGHDHLGHGGTAKDSEDYGFFGLNHGNRWVIEDIKKVKEMLVSEYENLPFYIMGHSMGSFLVRQFLQKNSTGISGVVIMGTGHKSTLMLMAGRMLCRIVAEIRGWRCRSQLIYLIAFGSYNRKCRPRRTRMDWISVNEKNVRSYVKDPRCGFMFTVNGYDEMFKGLLTLNRKGSLKDVPGTLPVLFVSGREDPVGNYGRSVEMIYKKYLSSGIKNTKMILYDGCRHEILNEDIKDRVFRDIGHWIETVR